MTIRRTRGEQLRKLASEMFVPVDPKTYLPRLTLLENLIYGRMSSVAGVEADLVVDAVSDVLTAHDMRREVAANVFDVHTAIGGTNLPPAILERAAFTRASIKRPDVLIFDKALQGSDLGTVRARISELLPDTTQIFLDDRFDAPETYDMFVEIKGGRVDGMEGSDAHDLDASASDDLRRKLSIIQHNDLFGTLEPRAQRLLSFAATWYDAPAGSVIFNVGQSADAVYLCVVGKAEISIPNDAGDDQHIATIEPGRVIGDLAVILGDPRQVTLKALEPTQFLRVGAEQFRAVIENDKTVLLRLLKTVGGHLSAAAESLRDARIDLPRNSDKDDT